MKKKYLLLGVLAIALLVTAGFAYQSYREKRAQEQWIAHMTDTVERSTFYEGIFLDDVPLSGLTLQEASDQFQKAAEERLANLRVELTYEDQSWVFTHEDIQAQIDWEDRLDELFQLAREGQLEDRYNEVEEIREKGVREETTLTMDIAKIRGDIEEIAESLAIQPVDADITFYPNEKEKFSLSPEQAGQIVDAQALYQSAENILSSEQPGKIAIEPIVAEANVRMADLEKATSKIVTFSTSMKGSTENRMSNIGLALKKINGTKLNPGEVFSFNETVGKRTEKAGFKLAGVIKADKSLQDGIGGGICQASSTVFNAVSLSGLEIVERYHHSFPVSYLDAGLDATVSWGGADLKFKNDRDTPIFIRSYRNGTKAYVEIYGEPVPNNGKYKLTTKVTETIKAPEPKRVEDKKGEFVTKPGGEYEYAKSRMGYKVNTYRVLIENGKTVSSELFVRNYYRPIQGITYYREGKPEPTPSPTPAPTTAPKEEPSPEPEPKPEPSTDLEPEPTTDPEPETPSPES